MPVRLPFRSGVLERPAGLLLLEDRGLVAVDNRSGRRDRLFYGSRPGYPVSAVPRKQGLLASRGMLHLRRRYAESSLCFFNGLPKDGLFAGVER
jgi:hypothetical protein